MGPKTKKSCSLHPQINVQLSHVQIKVIEGKSVSTATRDRLSLNYSGSKIHRFPSLSPVCRCCSHRYIDRKQESNDGKAATMADKSDSVRNGCQLTVLTPAGSEFNNLENQSAGKIAFLKLKLDEQLRAIETLTKKSKDKPTSIALEQNEKTLVTFPGINSTSINCSHSDRGLERVSHNVVSSQTTEKPQRFAHAKKRRNRSVQSKSKQSKRGQGCETVLVQQSSARKISRNKRRRALRKKESPHKPVVDTSGRLPDELTKEEFLRNLRLMPVHLQPQLNV